jgi:hypothetical protein
MPKPKHPYFDAIFDELSELGNVTPRSMFGHSGYGLGTSVFAFLDEDRLVVRTEKYVRRELPKDLVYFMPEIFQGRTVSGRWVGIPFDDSLASLRKHWHLIEESYRDAIRRQDAKRQDAKRQDAKRKPASKSA